MDYATEASELQTRIKRLEDQLKILRYVFVITCLTLGSLIWPLTRPNKIVEARQFNVVDGAGKTVAELSQGNGGAHLVLYDDFLGKG